eukprot:188313-Karenia_brevis.AAC.1
MSGMASLLHEDLAQDLQTWCPVRRQCLLDNDVMARVLPEQDDPRIEEHLNMSASSLANGNDVVCNDDGAAVFSQHRHAAPVLMYEQMLTAIGACYSPADIKRKFRCSSDEDG